MKSILKVGLAFGVFILKNLLRLTLVISVYLFRMLAWISDMLSDLAFSGCVYLGVFKETEDGDAPNAPTFDPKFSEDEIEAMVQEVQGKNLTIKEVQELLGVSYRQARKVQKAVENSLPVRHFSLAA